LSQLAQIAAFLGIFFLISGPVHECAHAWTASKLGDNTARLFGRVTLNPIAHFDPIGGMMIVLASFAGFGIGWAKPTPVNPYNLRGRYADTLVSVAGPLSNLVIAAFFAIALRLLDGHWGLNGSAFAYEADSILGAASVLCFIGVQLNVMLMIFNLLPIPPLDGSHVLFDMLDRETAQRLRPILDQYGIFILILFILPIFQGSSLASLIFQHVGYPIVGLLIGAPIGLN